MRAYGMISKLFRMRSEHLNYHDSLEECNLAFQRLDYEGNRWLLCCLLLSSLDERFSRALATNSMEHLKKTQN